MDATSRLFDATTLGHGHESVNLVGTAIDPGLPEQFITAFVSDHHKRQARLREASAAGDAATVRDAAQRLTDLGLHMQKNPRDGIHHLPGLDVEFRCVQAALDHFMNQQSPHGDGP